MHTEDVATTQHTIFILSRGIPFIAMQSRVKAQPHSNCSQLALL